MNSIGENMYNRRKALKISRAALARILGTNETQIKRWEVRSPPSELLLHIARALNFSTAELLGEIPTGLDLSGEWYAVWDTTRDGLRTLNKHELDADHSGEFVHMDATGDPDYPWRMDLRLSGSILKGSYRAIDEGRTESGTMTLTLNHHGGSAAIGHWNGAWSGGIGGVGFAVIARDPNRVDQLMKLLKDQGTLMITEWPKEDRG